jgi:putative membrane protein
MTPEQHMIDYDPHAWRKHLLDIKGSMFREIIGRVSTCVAWSVVVAGFHAWVYQLHIPGAVHGYIGLALSLLLVFRTNAAYDRYWEGRRQWGSINNESRNLARATSAYMKNQPALRDEIIRWTVAFAYATMYSLRGKKGIGPIADHLPPAEVEAVQSAPHVPLAIAMGITERIVRARDLGIISDYLMVALDKNVQLLMDYMGACERIAKTPLPFPYVVHLRRSLILYCFTLPFALVETFGWVTIPGTLFVAYILFGIEEIGVEIGDPFGVDTNDLPLDRICATIDRSVMSLIGEAGPPPAVSVVY